MALIFADGFDHYTDELVKYNWEVKGGQISTSTDYARYGNGKGLRMRGDDNASYCYLVKGNLRTTGSTMVVCAAIKLVPLDEFGAANSVWPPQLSTTQIEIRDSYGNNVFGLGFKDCMYHIRQHDGTYVNTGRVIEENEWVFVEMKAVASTGTGYYVLRLNEEVVYSYTGATISATDSPILNQIWLHEIPESLFSNPGARWWIDDLFALDESGDTNNDFIGDCQVISLYPNNSGTYTQWEVTGATYNYDAVNEELDYDTASYVYTSGSGKTDSYNYQDLDLYNRTIHGVQLNAVVRKTDGGGVRVAGIVRQGGVDYSGTGTYINASWSNAYDNWDQNPSGTVAWTETTINNSEFGITVL